MEKVKFSVNVSTPNDSGYVLMMNAFSVTETGEQTNIASVFKVEMTIEECIEEIRQFVETNKN